MSMALGVAGSTRPFTGAMAKSEPGEIKLVLLGTQGGPNFQLDRGETACLLITGEETYLIDCGYGTLRSLKSTDVSFLDISRVFLTHLHDDHTADIVSLLGHQWTQGRVEPTTVYGPYGTDKLIQAALQYNLANTEIRMLDEGRSVRPEQLFSGKVVPATDQPNRVYEDSHVTVSSIENSHFPSSTRDKMPYRALSYRFENEHRSIVFSGDTSYSDNLVSLARDADILVCETINIDIMRGWYDDMLAKGFYADNPEGIWKHIIETHTSTEDAGRMAQQAGVKLLVLNHLLPGSTLGTVPDEVYLDGVRKYYQGEVIIGEDLLSI